ncbi:hypothetical protein JX265_010840 [Neoarthrinium moseri]|uniref:Uncharacterized protein n=1 Tax=Neoarthrinium moseri TaxID=1658444 RepID=A0A9P9WDA2_9PEZI|nr:hypothetical protein JX265_010840 [Neoarthrinium moseri]
MAPITQITPPSPKEGIDWTNVSGQYLPLNGHIEVRFRASTGKWDTPTLVEGTNISVSGLSPGLNYGQQCYEGLKAFRTASTETKQEEIHVFRPAFHAARMTRSAMSICLPPPSEELFLECIRQAVAQNAEYVPPADSSSFLYIRPVLFGASTGLWGPCDEAIFAVYVQPANPHHGVGAVSGIVCEEFDRSAPRGMGSFKVGGNYAPVWRHAAKAMKLGFGIMLHLDSATHSLVEEFSTSGFLGHKMTVDGQHVLVIPASDSAIESATSDALATIARRQGWMVEQAQLPFSSLGNLDEVIACGTAAAAVPIRSLTRMSTNEKFEFGSDHKRWNLIQLAVTVDSIQRGKSIDEERWCWTVTGFPALKSS